MILFNTKVFPVRGHSNPGNRFYDSRRRSISLLYSTNCYKVPPIQSQILLHLVPNEVSLANNFQSHVSTAGTVKQTHLHLCWTQLLVHLTGGTAEQDVLSGLDTYDIRCTLAHKCCLVVIRCSLTHKSCLVGGTCFFLCCCCPRVLFLAQKRRIQITQREELPPAPNEMKKCNLWNSFRYCKKEKH